MRNKVLFPALLGLALVISACGAAAPTAAPATDTAVPVAPTAMAATDTAMPPATATVSAGKGQPNPTGSAQVMVGQNAALGSFLVDANGMTLYIYLNDQPGQSNCTGACLSNWPPLLTNGAPTGGQGVNAGMLGTIQRSDGTTQVTYNGWPLYYFIADKASGDTNGEGKGSVWYVITPDGTQK